PHVDGALTSIMGENYLMHAHRHCHYNPPKSGGQGMHKDSWAKFHHHTRWAMVLYYPQDTPPEIGPTAVAPGSQYYNTKAADGNEVQLHGEAGTIAIIHYDLWHRATPNLTDDKKRFMMKFLFTRMEEPEKPSWENKTDQWLSDKDSPDYPMWHEIWNWHRGEPNPIKMDRQQSISELIENLQSEDESTCLRSAYALCGSGQSAIPNLVDTLQNESKTVRRNVTYALSSMNQVAVPALIEATKDTNANVRAGVTDALGDISLKAQDATSVLIDAATDSDTTVRQLSTDALGLVGQKSSAAVPVLAGNLQDSDDWVRRNASLALARLGSHAEEAVPDLKSALKDENRYVCANSLEAMKRINTPESETAVLDFLITSRWCPITSKKSTF
ncbi:TPA: hypothetical protein EYM26_11670, partial [Candidatus Poribacteria bacterium]|nr:hypothetical protein [Candidatus Poribacteria bacterium]